MKITERKRWCHRWLLSLESEGQGRMMLKTIWKRRAMLQVPIEVKKMTDGGWWTDNHWELEDESGEEQKWWRRMRCWSQVRRWDDRGDAGRSKEGEAAALKRNAWRGWLVSFRGVGNGRRREERWWCWRRSRRCTVKGERSFRGERRSW